MHETLKEILKFGRATGADSKMLNRVTDAWHIVAGEWL
jgi:hypothetical protein